MTGPLSGPGVGLQVAQYLYPSELTNAPVDFSGNRLALAPGDAIALPRGDWYVDTGQYGLLQYQDPANNGWVTAVAPGWTGGVRNNSSDGFTYRIGNMLGCPIGGVVTVGGGGLVQSTATIVAAQGTSQWSPIIGGALSLTSVLNNGLGYGIAPLVLIPAPPGPNNNPNSVGGIAASAFAILTGTSLTNISFTNQGAGYPSTVNATIVPSPFDPNVIAGNAITPATVQLSLTGAGRLTGAILTNSGAPLTDAQINANLTLIVTGGTTTASISALVLQTVKGYSINLVGLGYAAGVFVTTIGGGAPSNSLLATPFTTGTAFRPRQALIQPAIISTSVSTASVIVDGGLFVTQPSPLIIQPGLAPTTIANISLNMGSVADHVILQPLKV